MPNKHKNSKLRTKLLLSGKLNKKKEVQSTLKYLEEKTAIDNEDIDFDFENQKNNDFEKLEDGDDDTRKIKNPKKRKLSAKNANDLKKPKFDEIDTKTKASKNEQQKVSDSKILPRKSKKNKYFFMAHPEALDKKDEILSDEKSKSKFVIDEQKIKAIQTKKLKKPQAKEIKNTKKEKKKNKSNNLWAIEECNQSENDENKEKENKNKKIASSNSKNFILNLDDIDKSFKIKKTLEKLEDGSFVEVFKPEIVQPCDEKETDDSDNENEILNCEKDEELSENECNEEDEEVEIHQKSDESKVKKSSNKIETKKDLLKNTPMEKLQSSRFRYLNELLYSQPSSKSFEFFKNDEDSFKAYHEGFKNQITKWPINPLDEIIKYIKSRPGNLIVADFGCGEARLAQSVKNKVHSFDLVAINDLIVRCDMKKVPLESNTCDVAVFCLSLMGTNITDFLCEAHRVLKLKGVLKIAEVVSRIEDKGAFIKNVELIGFKLVSKKEEISKENCKDYFYFFDFVKISPNIKKKPVIKLNPCVYKKR